MQTSLGWAMLKKFHSQLCNPPTFNAYILVSVNVLLGDFKFGSFADVSRGYFGFKQLTKGSRGDHTCSWCNQNFFFCATATMEPFFFCVAAVCTVAVLRPAPRPTLRLILFHSKAFHDEEICCVSATTATFFGTETFV